MSTILDKITSDITHVASYGNGEINIAVIDLGKVLGIINDYRSEAVNLRVQRYELLKTIDRQDKWLQEAGYTPYNVDIALQAIRLTLKESEVDTKDVVE